jgi:hypothetical protein
VSKQTNLRKPVTTPLGERGTITKRMSRMNKKHNLLTQIATAGLMVCATAATCAADQLQTKASPVHLDDPAPSFLHGLTLGLEAGTTGAGGRADWRFMDHFGVGTAFDYFSYSDSATIQGITYNADLRLMSQPLTLNLYPWASHSFHVSLGVMFNENQLKGDATGAVNLGGTPYTGHVHLKIEQEVADPYLSIGGNLYFDKAQHWSLGGELGVTYTGDPSVTLTTSPAAPPAQLQAERSQVKDYARDAQFWPVLKVSLNYSF